MYFFTLSSESCTISPLPHKISFKRNFPSPLPSMGKGVRGAGTVLEIVAVEFLRGILTAANSLQPAFANHRQTDQNQIPTKSRGSPIAPLWRSSPWFASLTLFMDICGPARSRGLACGWRGILPPMGQQGSR